MNAAEFAWWAVTGQRLPPREEPKRTPVALVGWPRAGENEEAEASVTRCGLCSERIYEHEAIVMWSEVLMQHSHLCVACADEEQEAADRLARLEDYADALAAQDEEDRR